ncbi:MAG: M13 family peptidase [Bacteroidetes bacterium]|nr:MAG: M13 family peptidase [Bacteroidota bacterium]
MKKMNFFALAAIALLLLGACENTKKVKEEKTMTKAIDLASMDKDLRPGDDFFRFVNGGWMKENPIPPEHSTYGAFIILYEQNQEDLKQLVKEVSAEKDANNGSVSQKIRDFYNSGMDTIRIEELGVNAIRKDIDEINALKSKTDVQAYIAKTHKAGASTLFYFFSSADQRNSSMEIANFYQGGLGLPDVDYYLNDDDRSVKLREAYSIHLAKMFQLMGDDKATAIKGAATILKMETSLAKVSKTRLERRDPIANYNKMSLAELKELSPDFDWDIYFTTLGLPDPGDMNVSQTDFIAGLSPLMKQYSLDDWKTYLLWSLVDGSATYLSNDFVEQNFDFFGKTLSGRQEMRARWKRVLDNTSGALGEAIGQLYVEKHFPPESKSRMITLVENLRKSFAQRIAKLDWMDEETKKKAIEKLDAITVKIGYPDKWKDYSKLNVVADSYLQNVRAANTFEFDRTLEKIGKPVDKSEWGMTPQTVNAYYNPTNNEIVFPAGILQPPFFNKDADDAVNYGAIGVVIGHEMTHGFDDQGRQYDKDGNLNDWWTEDDAKRFADKTALLASQYDNYTILDSLNVDGQLTMGENIADLGGLNISFDALLMSMNGNKPAPIEGYTYDQRFFMGYAQVWRQNIRDKELMRRLKEDVHSPGEARVNIPPFNMDIFINAFGITADDKLFIPVQKRAYIW